MGTNKRYAAAIDRRMGERADEIVMRDAKPESLKTAELELDKYALVIRPPTNSRRGLGSLRRHPTARIKGEAVKWTEKVVAVQWETPLGQHKAWLWASAVDRAV